ncbi:putative Heterokaryon incompatibility domain-containing protein [Seiridium cardinale]
MSGFPNSADEAREHIQKIRSQKGLNGYETDVSDLENALQLLSDQLYQRPVHFLLELIQNADDNKYGDVLPTLSINYQDHQLTVYCNELGFSKKNVESLCRIGSSTKQGSTTTEHYTGEKGIGFKSVFKVADVVRVRSGHYSFKFDRSQKLGMIAPSWCEVSRPGVFTGTSFILEIPQDFDVQPVLKEIRGLDSRMLLFLRRLRRIDLTINSIGGGFWHNTISRRDELPSGSGILRSVTLQYGDQAHLYYVINYIAKGLPHDDQRPKTRHADITLAFPVDEVHAEEVPSAQLVYSTLPVRDYGFKFLLNADFVLTASREDIDQASAWNLALCEHMGAALSQAIHTFNETFPKFSWLRYFPIRPPTKDCFQIFAEQGVQEVCRERILLAHSEDFVSPRYLLSVPLAFQDGQGNPLLAHDTLNVRYLSNQYTSTDWPVIRRLGVRKMRAQDFVEHLSALITAVPVHVSNQSTEWQSRLARGLMGILSTNPECKPAIFDLSIVRLRSGTWITGYEASRGEVILPVDEDLVLPPGIRFVEVDPTLCADEHWRHLFNLMGIVPVSAERVCDEISKMHVNPRLKPSELRKDDLLLQVGFMYRAGWSNPEKRDLWFATSNGTCRHGSQLYVDSNQPHSATRYLGSMKEQFPFIHPDYLDCDQDDMEKLSDWLVKNFHFSAIPRIISNVLGTYSFRVSAEFEFILASFPVSEVPLLLRSHWMDYCRWIAPDRSNEMQNDLWQRSRRNFLHKLSSLEVDCIDGDHAKISNTALPIPKFLEDQSFSIKFIDIPDPENEEWEFLRHLGVLVGSSTAMDLTGALAETHIQRLQALQGELEPSMNRIKSQYRQLHLLAGREREAIRSSFVTKPLIYVPPTLNCSLRGWFRLEDCRWGSIESLRKTPFLSNVYPELGEFFCTTLGLQDADQSCIAEEALKVTHLDGLKYISKLFIAFSQHMSMNEHFIDNRARLKSQLLSRPIFPVLGTRESTPYMEFDQLQAAQEADVWFIADRVHLRNCFRGVVPILAIDTADIPRMKHLIRCLNLGNRLLSNIASGAIQTYSPVNGDQKATNIMRSKAPFIARLLPANARQNTLINQLKSTVVYATDQITVEWSIKLPNGELMPGRADSGSAKIDASGRSLVIYITRDYAASGACPIELVEYIADLCEIRDPRRMMLLQYLLVESDLRRIEEAFSRHGIPCGNAESDGDPEKPISKGYLYHATEPILSSDEGKALQSFLDDLEQARSIKNVTSRRWERNSAAQLKPFLSKICNLEKQDVSVFLPQSDIDQILGGSNRTNDKHEVAYFTSGLMSEEERHARTSLFFPAVVAVPKQGKPKFRMQVPAMNAQDPELAFLGELQAYFTTVGAAHASNLSTGNRLDQYSTHEGRTGAFTKLLTRNGYRGSTRWAADRTFYMDVITVNDGLEDSTFALHPHQLEIARKCYSESLNSPRPRSIAVLAFVSNIHSSPTIALFVNPWALYMEGHLDIVIESHSLARFSSIPSCVSLCPATSNEISSGMRRFHEPLTVFKSIRLLELLPGDWTDPLRGKISIHSMTNKPVYRALSYTWGASMKLYKLHTSQGILSITESLDMALRSIRGYDKPIYVWVDAICIDQDNEYEKVSQIRLMRDIFQSAKFVYGWLGPEEDDSSMAIDTLLQIRMQAYKDREWPVDLPSTPLYWAGHKIPPPNSTVWEAIDALFGRDWFERVWIMQEIILAPDVIMVCGRRTARWQYLFEALEICLREAQVWVERSEIQPDAILQTTAPAVALGQTRKLYSDGPVRRKHSLLTLFELFAHTKATLELDKMFGLLGLATDAENDDLNPDYSSLETVVRRYAGVFVAQGNVVDLLHQAGGTKAYAFSSWIPAWTRERQFRTISTWNSRLGYFRASGDSSAYAFVSGKILTISGTIVDSVSAVNDVTLQDSDVWTFVNSMYTFLDTMVSYPTGETMEQVKLMLPIGNACHPYLEKASDIKLQTDAGDGSEDFEWAQTLSKFSSIQALLDFLRQPAPVRMNLWKYWRTVSAFSLRLSLAKFFITANGYVGLAPADITVGDAVVIFQGGLVPFVIKPGAGSGGRSRLVGECYVHGLMHGEASQLPDAKEDMIFLE